MKIFTIPNIITLANLSCGILGIWCVFSFRLEIAAYLILAGAVLDFFDGLAARLLNSFSEIGKELDSLADMVTFGVLPTFILYYLLNQSLPKDCLNCLLPNPWILISIVPALFSALRLAKFNIDARQTDGFLGLPTPSNAIVVASFVLIGTFQPLLNGIFGNYIFLVLYSIAISVLMISDLPMASLKFKNFSWRENKLKYTFLIVTAALIVVFKFAAIPFSIGLYVLFSLTQKLFLK